MNITLSFATAFLVPQGFLPDAPIWESVGVAADEFRGFDAGDAGDVDGDGIHDLIVLSHGTPQNPGVHGRGRADLYLGMANGYAATPAWSVRGGFPTPHLDYLARAAGDLNGDGYGDLLFTVNSTNAGGIACVFYGGPQGPHGGADATLADADWTASGSNSTFRGLGEDGAAVGDVNDDGYDDLLLGADFHTGAGGSSEGAACLFLGSAVGLTGGSTNATGEDADWVLEGGAALRQLGRRVHAVGDVNGDGCKDFAVTAVRGPGDSSDLYAHWVFLGVAGGLPASTFGGAYATFGGYGVRVGADLAAADFNKDGHHDIVIAFPQQFLDGWEPLELHFGGTLAMSPSSWRPTTNPAEGTGWSLAAADFDGDGWEDVAVLSGISGSSSSPPGRVRVFAGKEALGVFDTPLKDTPAWELDLLTSQSNDLARVAALRNGGAGFPAGLLVAEPYAKIGPDFRAGRVTVHENEQPEIDPCPHARPRWTRRGKPGDRLGFHGAVADFDGDGYDDVLVGRRYFPDHGPHLELYRGSATGLESTPSTTADAPISSGGVAPVATGDVNQDGCADVLVLVSGNAYWPSDPYSPRAAFVYLGVPTTSGVVGGIETTPVWRADPATNAPTHFACSGALLDVNGDGYGDVALGARGHAQLPPWLGDPFDIQGAVYVWYGGSGGLAGAPATTEQGASWSATHSDTEANFGITLRAANVDGDAYDDLIVGAPGHTDDPQTFSGSIYAYQGSAAGLNGGQPGSETSHWQELRGPLGDGAFGQLFDAGADVTGDGRPDLVMPRNSGVELREGGSAGFEEIASQTVPYDGPLTYATNCALIPDFDGDGLADLVVASTYGTGAAPGDGKLVLYRGRGLPGPDAIDPAGVWRASGGQAFAQLGFGHLLAHGDVNADERADLLAGSWGHGGGAPYTFSRGRFALWHGTKRPQLRVDETTLPSGGTLDVAHLGWNANTPVELFAQAAGSSGPPSRFVTLALGMTDAHGCWQAQVVLPPSMTAGVWHVRTVADDPTRIQRLSRRRVVVVQ